MGYVFQYYNGNQLNFRYIFLGMKDVRILFYLIPDKFLLPRASGTMAFLSMSKEE